MAKSCININDPGFQANVAMLTSMNVVNPLFEAAKDYLQYDEIRSTKEIAEKFKTSVTPIDFLPQSIPISLESRLTEFLKGLNIDVTFYKELKSITGYDAIGTTDLLHKMVLLKEGAVSDKVYAKEVAYVAYSLLGKKNKIRTDLVHSISQLPAFEKAYSVYKLKAPLLSEYKIKELITVDFIADSIINNWNIAKDSYIYRENEYWTIKGNSKLEKKIKYYLMKLKLKLLNFLNIKRLNKKATLDLIDMIASDVINHNYKRFHGGITENFQLTNYERTIGNDPIGRDLINYLSSIGMILSGSLALRKQGTLYRQKEDDTHDLDFTVDIKEITPEMWSIMNKLKQLDKPDPTNVSFAILDNIKRKKLMRKLSRLGPFQKIKAKYPTFNVTSVFEGTTTEGSYTVTGKIGNYTLDFFINTDPEGSLGREKSIANWEYIFKAKIIMGRAKDINDLVNYIPYNITSKKYAQDKGFRHFNFDNINTDIISDRTRPLTKEDISKIPNCK